MKITSLSPQQFPAEPEIALLPVSIGAFSPLPLHAHIQNSLGDAEQGGGTHGWVLPGPSGRSEVPSKWEECRALCQRRRHQANGVLGSLVPPRSPCLASPSCGGNQKVHPERIANLNAVGPYGGKRL